MVKATPRERHEEVNNFGDKVGFIWSVADLKKIESDIADMLAEVAE